MSVLRYGGYTANKGLNLLRRNRATWFLAGASFLVTACTLSSEGLAPSDGTTTGGNTAAASVVSSVGVGGASTSSQTVGVGAGGSGGVGTGGFGPEDCFNDVDDDGDGDMDCDDSDCIESSCVEDVVGGVYLTEVASPGMCTMLGGTLVEVLTCSGCSCLTSVVGTCTHMAEVWKDATCQTTIIHSSVLPAFAACETVALASDANTTIGAKATPVGLDDATCIPDGPQGATSVRQLCTLPAAGSCIAGTCVPEAVDCVKLDGDVECPKGFPTKETIFDGTTAAMCDCACGVDEQQCPTNKHYHAHIDPNCTGAKTDVEGDGACYPTTYMKVGGLKNHDATFDADAATCEVTATPQGGATQQTVCCQE